MNDNGGRIPLDAAKRAWLVLWAVNELTGPDGGKPSATVPEILAYIRAQPLARLEAVLAQMPDDFRRRMEGQMKPPPKEAQ